MDDLVQVVPNATEPFEEIKCDNCGSVVRFHPKAMKKCEYIKYGETHTNQYIDCPKCFCAILRYSDR